MAHISGELIIDAAFTEVVGTAADERNESRDSTGSSGRRCSPAVRSELEPASSPNPRAWAPEASWLSRSWSPSGSHRLHVANRSSYMHVDGTITFAETEGGTRLPAEARAS
jgi:hypothetical protein